MFDGDEEESKTNIPRYSQSAMEKGLGKGQTAAGRQRGLATPHKANQNTKSIKIDLQRRTKENERIGMSGTAAQAGPIIHNKWKESEKQAIQEN